jgi:Family of unknown function (DUF6527)
MGKLIDLDPRWFVLEEGGPRVGMSFLCPHCKKERLGILFHHSGRGEMERQYILAHTHGDPNRFIWDLTGDDFTTLTLSPSIDASRSGHWHGFITNGEVLP